MAIRFTNNASATLASSITNVATSISVTAGQGALFPSLSGSDYFYATLADSSNNLEIVKVTARATDALTVVRAQGGTSARAYTAGDKLELRVVAESLEELVAQSTAATTSVAGIVQLNSATNSTSTTQAATPSAVKTAYDLAAAAMPQSGGTFSGAVTFSSTLAVNGVATFASAPVFNNDIGIQAKDSAGTIRNLLRLNSSNNVLLLNSGNGSVLVRNQGDTATLVTLTDASGNFTATGNVTAYSDERLKRNWADLQPGFIDAFAQVKMGTYERTDCDIRQVGVSAQSLQEVMPEAVHEDIDGMLSVAYGQAALSAAVALAREVVELKKRLEVLEAK